MSTTIKTVSVAVMAALLAGLLFLSPVGVSSAQTDDDATTEDGSTTEESGGRGPGALTDEEREALQAEREARRQEVLQALADELGVTVDELTTAMQNVAIAQVEQRLAAGDIAQDQADAIIERIESGDGPGFGFGFGGGRGGHHGPRGPMAPDADSDADASETGLGA